MNRARKATVEHEVDDQIVVFKISNMNVACNTAFLQNDLMMGAVVDLKNTYISLKFKPFLAVS